ncbi:glucosylceramidase [Nonomuraea jiangxiensis]|uniref:Glucosylceramidase n=1 Tax=Nonomuraea jiangxiensis TaxID=633440 RepID=A0A1G9UP61_9ACTN|nr:glucosylceramidase [Nonomuraea jiangxiensis]
MGRNRLLKGVVGAAVMAFGLTAMPSAASAAAGDRIKIIEFNLCLDVKEFSTKDGARVQLWSCNGNANQRWRMYKDGTIRSALNGKCLDVREFNAKNGAIVQMWSCSGASNQQWYWSNSKYTRAGYRMLRSRLNNFCLDATGKQHKLGTPLQMWSCSSAWNQAFRWI